MAASRLLQCAECGCSSDERAEGWTGFLTEDADGSEPTGVAVFCPACATEHFGWVVRQPHSGWPYDEQEPAGSGEG
jgi:hypothetical protein